VPNARPDSAETFQLLERAAAGDAAAVDVLLASHREVVRAFIAARIDPRIRSKEDASDIVQQTLTQCSRRLKDYLNRRPMPFQLWVLATAREVVLKTRRKWHSKSRDVDDEEKQPDNSSFALVQSIVGRGPSPSEDAQGRELAELVAKAVDALDEEDREILTLREIDDLAHREIALMLDISEVNARQRYGRARIHLQRELKKLGITGSAVR
jgi:RNA polymerase sigma-70 factor (subfamily 1)